MGKNGRDRLAEALEAMKTLQDRGPCYAIKGMKTLGEVNSRMLLENGFLEEVIKGWYIPSTPSHVGTTTTWYASFWGFVAAYCDSRFGNGWTLTPEESLSIWSGANVIPSQVVVQAKKGSNSIQQLIHGHSIFNFTTRIPDRIVRDPTYGLNLYPLEMALLRCSPDFFATHVEEVRACLHAIEPGDALSSAVADYGGEHANRLVGALRAVGRHEVADFIAAVLESTGRRLVAVNPFVRKFEAVRLPERSPHSSRIRLLWSKMRERVLALYPAAESALPRPIEDVLRELDEGYVADSYHSLSIEGYRVTEELIRRIRDGVWDPEAHAQDGDQRTALAASGYYRAYRRVRADVARIICGEQAGEVISSSLEDWHRELFMPCVDAGLIRSGELSGYRRTQVYIAGSRYTPPSAALVVDSMEAFLDLVRTEPDPRVRAILGHFFFVHIHPYADGNGRTARFIMNVSLITSGYRWKVIPVERRDDYMSSLERASVTGEIDGFVNFIKDC